MIAVTYSAGVRSNAGLAAATPSGEAIPIEERAAAEVTTLAGVATAPGGIAAANPAFDVTPAQYVTAIITENGVARPPYTTSLAALLKQEAPSRG